MQVISRSEALARGLKTYFTGKPCKHGHITERQVDQRACLECDRVNRRVENMTPEQVEQQRAWQRGWAEANLEKERARQRAWNKANPEYWRATVARDRARKLQAMPAWADPVAIAAVYAEADRLTRETGIPHHVDHIVPLQSPIVCGLHVPANLRPLPALENLRKGNRYWEGL